MSTEITGSNLEHFFLQTLIFLPFFDCQFGLLGKKSLEFLLINIASFLPSSGNSSFQATTDLSWGSC